MFASPSLPVTGNTSITAPENRQFYPALDGLRAVAFLMVFLQHYASLPWGWTGVNVFFVLSGFLITGILFDSRDDAYRARNFYIRRTLRIFPLYYTICAATLLLAPLVHWRWSLLWLAWPLYLGNFLRFLSPASGQAGSRMQLAGDAHLIGPGLRGQPFYLGHFWSLCVEEQFYLFWPWIVFKARSRRTLIGICLFFVITVPLLRVVAQRIAPSWMLSEELLYRFSFFQLDSLLLGGLIALLWRGANRDLLLRMGRTVAALCTVAAAVYLAVTIHSAPHAWREFYPYPAWRFTGGLLFVNIFAASVILSILEPSGWLHRLLCQPPLRWLGRISYGAYVLHDIPHNLYNGVIRRIPSLVPQAGVFTAVFALLCTMGLAWLSFRFLESPFLNLKERWTRR